VVPVFIPHSARQPPIPHQGFVKTVMDTYLAPLPSMVSGFRQSMPERGKGCAIRKHCPA
jgi:hypothetical protein